jgi:all-trans-retinol dehydrogenase (NAD+)
MSDFKDKKVLITGGASGIGLLMGKMSLEAEAAELIIWDINQQLMAKEIDNLLAESHKVSGQKVDVSDAKSVGESAASLINEGKVPDIVILNAGVVSGKYFHEHLDGEIEKTIGVNVLGCMLVTRAFLPEMIRRGSGHIVTIASAAGMLSNPKMAVYAASKWAVLGWSESLRLEMEQLRTGIRVTNVTPSYIDTGMFDGVKTNFLFPTLKPEKAASKIIRGIRRNKVFVRMPFMVYFIPFFKGILPAKWFDVIVGKGLGVYKTMNEFKGRA